MIPFSPDLLAVFLLFTAIAAATVGIAMWAAVVALTRGKLATSSGGIIFAILGAVVGIVMSGVASTHTINSGDGFEFSKSGGAPTEQPPNKRLERTAEKRGRSAAGR